MAVIDELGLEAKVVVNGATAPEYDDPEPGSLGDKYSGNTVKCFRYVESTDDAEFEIAFQAHAYNWPKTAGFALFFHLQVDGKSVGSRLLKEKDGLRQQWINGRVIQDTASHTGFSLQRTRFSKVLTGELHLPQHREYGSNRTTLQSTMRTRRKLRRTWRRQDIWVFSESKSLELW